MNHPFVMLRSMQVISVITGCLVNRPFVMLRSMQVVSVITGMFSEPSHCHVTEHVGD